MHLVVENLCRYGYVKCESVGLSEWSENVPRFDKKVRIAVL